MKFLKNLALMLSLVLVLNTILPQAAVFAQEATKANQLAATEATVNTEPTKTMATKEMTVPTVPDPTSDATVTTATTEAMVNVTVDGSNLGSFVVSGQNGQTGPGAYPYRSNLTVNATPHPGYTVSSIVAYPAAGGIQEVDNTSTANFVLTGDVMIASNFQAINYDIVVESSDTNLGTVANASGSYVYGENVKLSANPAPGYECISYSFTYGPAKNYIINYQYTGPISVPVTQSGTYQLFFQPQTFNLSVVSDGNGTVTGAGNYDYNTQATITATPKPGYAFSSWTENNGSIVSTNATETLTVTQAGKYTANFVQVAANVQVSANPVAGGTVTGGGTVDFGTSATLTATPTENYRFVQWINPQTQAVISKSSNYTFTASAATAGQYMAVFEAILYPVTIKPIASGAALADITVTPSPGTGNYAAGTVLPLSAASTASGVTFLGWYADGVLLTTASTYSYTVTGPAIITPRFNTDWGCVIASADPFSVMTVDIEVQPQGTNLNFYAPTSSTYDFVNWTNSAGTIVSTSQSLAAVVKGDFQSFTAHYSPKTFTISVVGTPTRGGTVQVTSASSMTYGKNATVVATAVLGYSFSNWTDGDTGQIMSTTPTYTFGPEKNTNLVGHFTQNTYSLDLSVNPVDDGTVSGGADNLIYGQVVNILATPDDGYIFTGWIDGSGNTVSTSAKYSVTMTGNMSLTASFSEIQYPISVTATPSEGGTVTGSGSFVNGTAVTLIATPNPNYNFIRWTLGDSDLAVSTNPQYNFTASEATQGDYTAVFELESYSVNISLLAQVSVADQVILTPQSGLYSYGTVLNLNAAVAIPNPALHFLGWYENGKEISKDQNFEYTVAQATKLSAIFVTDYGVIITYGDPLSAQPADVMIAPKTESKTISAATDLPYNFVNWTDANGKPYTDFDGNPYTASQLSVTVGPDWVKTYVAHYAPKSFNVSVTGQTPGGTASSSLDSLDYGQWLTVTAVPDPGYAFLNWTDVPTGNVFSTNPNWTFLPAAEVNLQANFTHTAYTIGLNVDAQGGGTVAWADYPTVGPYYGDVITAVATPADGFVFDGWVNAAGDTVPGDSSFDYTVTGNESLTAAFHVSQNTITAVASPAAMGTATGGAIYNYKDQATLTATPNTGFEFINWTNNLDDTVITTPSFVVNVANDVTYTANFEILQCPVTLNFIDPSRSAYGSVQMAVSRVDVTGNMVLMPEGTVPLYGDQVVLTATPNAAMVNVIFKDYLDGTGALISYDAVYTIAAIAQPMDIQYDFVQEYAVTVPVSAEWSDPYATTRTLIPGVTPQTPNWAIPEVTGNFKDTITFDYGFVDENLVFDGWYTDTDTPVLVCSNTILTYQLLDTTPLVAKLHLKDIGILVENTYTSEESIPGVDLIGGEVSGSGYRNAGETLNVGTNLNANYNFEYWAQGSSNLSKSTSFTYTAAGQPGVDATPIQANYSPTACYLTLNANPKGGGQAAPSGYYPYGTLVTISQGNQAGYAFSHFEDGNGNTLTSVTPNTQAGTLTLYMTGNKTVVAVYKESSGSEVKKIVEIIAAAATLAAIAAGIAAAIYFGGDELLADAAVDAAEVALEDLDELAAGIVDKNPPDPDPDPDPDDKTHVLITAIAAPVDAGTVIGGESYRVGEMAVLKATANPGWVFENWTCEGTVVIDDPESKSISFLADEVDEGSILTAQFKQEFTITTNVTPEAGGTVTPTKTVVSGESATVTATLNEGYVFDGWFENDIQVSEDETYILEAVTENHTLTAQFELGAKVTLTSDLAVAEALVTFTGDGCYKIGDEHTVTASLPEDQAANYIFEGWYTALTDPVPLSTEASYTFTLEGDTALIASYQEAVTITTDATPAEGGTVTPTLQVAMGDDATVTATPNEGYIFDGWFEDAAQVSEDETYILEAVTESHDLTAQFELGANVTLTSDPAEIEPLVTLTGDGCFKIGDEQTVTATLAEDQTENYIFNGWYASLADDVALSTSESYTFTLAEDVTLIANYKENSFTVDVTSEDDKMGTVTQTGANPYKLSDSVTVTAVPEKGYKFAYWSNGSSVSVSQLAEYTFDVTDNATLIANFVGNSVKIQVQCDYVEGGTVTSDDVAIPETGLATTAGESITLKAEEKKGYEFEGWYENGKKVEKEATYTFATEKNRTLVAAFSHNGIMCLAFPDPIEGGRVYKVYQTSETKDEFYLNAVPLTGYEFVGWYDLLGIKVCDTPEYDFVAYYSRILFAKFQPIQYDVNVDIAPAQGGTVAGTGTYAYGKPVTLTATPELGYVFNGFSDSAGNLVCADSVYTFTTREAVQLTANFTPQTYNVTATVNDPTLGSVSDAGTYPAGASVSLEASAAAGARLVGWFENGQCVSQESSYTFTAAADRNLEIDFSNEAFVLTIMADPVSGGTVTGEGGYNPSSEADQASISAIPLPGYSFTAWLDADTGEQISTQSNDAITLTKDTNLTAVFTPNIYQVNVTSSTGGIATGNGPYNFGDTVTLSALSDFGYAFAGWMMTDAEGNQSCISPDLDYSFTLNEDWVNVSSINISATFKNTKGALIIPLAEEYLRGNIARGYHLDATIGDTTTVEAIPGYGYAFTNWTDTKGNVVSQEAVYEFTVTGDTVLMAHFKSTETVKLTVTEESILQGKALLVGAAIAGEKEVESGQYVMAYAVAYPGNTFLHWVNQNGLKVSNARSYLFRISEDTTLTAVFEKTTHDIRANVDPEGTGYVFGQKTYTYGATATLTAIPLKLHYIFAYWSDENGRIKGAVSPVFKPVVNGTKTYTAHFIKVEHEITATAVPDQGGTVAGGGLFTDGDSVTLTAEVNEGYQFDGWFVNGVSASTDASWTFNAIGHLAAEAHFSLNPPTINEADRYQPILENNSGLNVTVTGDLQSILTGSDIPKNTTAYAQLILDKIDPSDIGVWDKLLIKSVANGQRVGQCFNIRLNMLLFNYLLNTYSIKELSELNQPIQLSIDIGNLINKGMDFRLIRIHNGLAEEISCQLNGSILSFESQYFSSFALVYTPVSEAGLTDPDSKGSDSNLTDGTSSVSNRDTTVKSASTKNPKTGDSSSDLIIWSWLLISGFLCVGIYLRKRKKGVKLK